MDQEAAKHGWKSSTTNVYGDNKAAINIAHNHVHHDWVKHVEINRHFIKEKIEKGEVCMLFIPTAQQIADVLTKGMTRYKFEALTSMLGMINIHVPTRGEEWKYSKNARNCLLAIFLPGCKLFFLSVKEDYGRILQTRLKREPQ